MKKKSKKPNINNSKNNNNKINKDKEECSGNILNVNTYNYNRYI